jgi:predicted Zn-dependent peptidase
MSETSPLPDEALPTVRRLANGVQVVCDPMPGLQTLAVSVVAGRGARYEEASRCGWSHLMEHMVFKGAGGRSAQEIVEAIEAEGGQINAATGYERTSYQVRALEGGLDLGLSTISDLLFRPTMSPEDLAKEKQVIGQEIAEASDDPEDRVFEMAQTAAFPDQPLGRPILGTVESIGAATPQALAEWRARLYPPNALVVAASGAVEEAQLMEFAERDFALQAAEPGPALAFAPASFDGGAVAEADRLEQAHAVFLLPAPGAAAPEYFALRLFAEILGGGMASRLFQEARERRGLAYAIDAYAETYLDAGLLGVYAGCAAKDARELAQVVAGEIASLARQVQPAELARAKAQLKASMFMGRESPLARAEHAAGQLLIFGRLLGPKEIARRIDEVTAEDLQRLGERMLGQGRAAASVLGPKGALAAAEVFRKSLGA